MATPLPPALDGDAAVWFHATVLPVSLVHDEYFFMRALQAHELQFTSVGNAVERATRRIRAGDLRGAAAYVDRAAALVDDAGGLFRLVATMRPAAFHTFRQYTDGASAIQSEQYKRFELLCGEPPPARLHSEAFANVPTVRVLADSEPDTLTSAYADAREQGTGWMHEGLAAIERAMRCLESNHHRWKSTHLTLAERMLGDARGSGYTAGAGYLRAWVEHRLFWRLDADVVPVDAGCER